MTDADGLADGARLVATRDLPREDLSAAIASRLLDLGAPVQSIAAARKIGEPRSVVVVAGQQPVLLGGPSLVWAKACDALALAGAIEERFGVPAVAVFWNASEDHDHAECDHVRMDLGAEVETLRVPLPGDRRMLSRVEVPGHARELLASLHAKFPTGPARDEILAALEPARGDTMGSWFSRILLRLLGRHGLVVVEPETLRPFARAVVEFEIERPGDLAAAIRRTDDRAVELGGSRAFDLVRPELFFLVDAEGRRLRVTREADSWRVEDGRVLTSGALRALPADAFSWNVAARVLAQDLALPVAAQICGPSEMRYAARLAAAHALVHAAPPWLVPRTEWEFFTPRALRLCADLGIDWKDVRSLRRSGPPRSGGGGEPEALRALRACVAGLDGSGSAAVQRRRAALEHGVEAYAQALRRDEDEREAVRRARFRRLLELLAPEGEGQDRRISPLPWFVRMGTTWLGDLIREQRTRAPMLEPGRTGPPTIVVMVPPHTEEGLA